MWAGYMPLMEMEMSSATVKTLEAYKDMFLPDSSSIVRGSVIIPLADNLLAEFAVCSVSCCQVW